MDSEYDYIIVGAGTAGCVVAARLSENKDTRVLLLEAGAGEPQDAMAVPGAWPNLLSTQANWGDTTVVQSVPGITITSPRGRALGGSSSINGLNFLRGHRAGYDKWAAQGANGWAYDDLLPYFQRSENATGRDPAIRGLGGPLTVAPVSARNPVVAACVEAALETGHPYANDFSSGQETGFGWTDQNVVNGFRQSAADAYLRPVMNRPNLDVVTGALAHRLLLTDGRCTGVTYFTSGTFSAFCTREVIVTAGAIGSAQLLLLSGIGPAEHLNQVGVDVVHPLEGVGSNLHDHPQSTLVFRAKAPVPFDPSNAIGQAHGLVRTDPALAEPDLQFLFCGIPYHSPAFEGPENAFTICVSAMTPYSRGSLRLAGNKPGTPPLIDTNYYGDRRDITTMMDGLRIARKISQASSLDEWRDSEALPGDSLEDDASLREYLLKSLVSYFHYAGTCRMGDDEQAVVDAELRVRGVGGLRVADASVMPNLPTANTNATVYAIAERAAALIGS